MLHWLGRQLMLWISCRHTFFLSIISPSLSAKFLYSLALFGCLSSRGLTPAWAGLFSDPCRSVFCCFLNLLPKNQSEGFILFHSWVKEFSVKITEWFGLEGIVKDHLVQPPRCLTSAAVTTVCGNKLSFVQLPSCICLSITSTHWILCKSSYRDIVPVQDAERTGRTYFVVIEM